MESVHLQLPTDLLADVDADRGDIPRNAWIRRAIKSRLAREADRGERPASYRGASRRSSAQIKRDIQSRPKKGEQ